MTTKEIIWLVSGIAIGISLCVGVITFALSLVLMEDADRIEKEKARLN
jgi:hypothetical protein